MDAVVAAWRASGWVRPCISAEQSLLPAPARFAPLPTDMSRGLRDALVQGGVEALYSHQAEAISAALAKRHVVIATPTASGKSLCFHVPVLEAMLAVPSATALYVYPTKALSRDQEHSLGVLLKNAGVGAPATVFDGDTPNDARKAARERCRIVLTNPDMLHAGILPSHARWARFFQGLRYVVFDELHTYRGVFGSHLAHVVARLKRVAGFHGAEPTLIGATATIGNPREHAARLFGVEPGDVTLVDQSGAPRSPREVFIYNPPVVNEELGIRASTLKQAVALAADLVRARVSTIVFAPSRNSVEVMLKYLREKVADDLPPEAIMGYRGGYLPETRRRVETGLRNGEILGVVATNALELGIDIGDLDAVICAGYPGSVAGTWQRFGRAGRRGSRSIAVLVCSSDPLDQFLAREPSYVLDARAEEARIDPSNTEILIQHLKCAAFEAPFELGKASAPDTATNPGYLGLDGASTRDALDYLARHGLVHEADGRHYWSGEAFPASNVSLRSVGWDNFVIVDVENGKSIAELDFRATHTMLHEQAIYQHDAEQFQVERLDFDNHKAFVRKVAPDYFTTALTYRTVAVIEERLLGELGSARTGFGDVKVVEKVTGYKKIKFFTHENAGYGDVHLPELQMHTTSFWITLPERLVGSFGEPRALVIAALRGVGQALETVAALALMCDPRDLGRTLGDGEGEDSAPGRDPFAKRTGGFDPTLFLFDSIPGGVGLAERVFERSRELFERTHELIASCGCRSGCPACVGPGDGDGSEKRLGLTILAALGVKGLAAPNDANLRDRALGSPNLCLADPDARALRLPTELAHLPARHG
ncbi:MAG TPA: DEAD/DEAH box helicase [Polyangiaceae bacterium]|nr:DEAD/DEAH box helicase [Polyangiaceae bacterium]